MKHKVFIGDVLKVLKKIPDESVDCIVTSPPYWSLRDYGEEANTIWGGDPDCEHEFGFIEKSITVGTDNNPNSPWNRPFREKINNVSQKVGFCRKCGAWYGQLGLEPTLDMFIEHMLQITAELKRVLKKNGVMFWNHGDNYSTTPPGNKKENWEKWKNEGDGLIGRLAKRNSYGSAVIKTNIPQKCMVLQNYRLILHMVDEQGWILRNVIIWHKPNHMPSSVKDRFANAYEPVFMLVKSKKYWFDLDAVRVPSKTGNGASQGIAKGKRFGGHSQATVPVSGFGERELKNHPFGKNPGDVWTIPTQPFPDAHFATFPEKLVEPMIKAGCPRWICKKCGFIRERITKTEYVGNTPNIAKGKDKMAYQLEMRKEAKHYTISWTDCGCNAGWEAGTVLDPFAGSGTTMLVAEKLGRNSIGIEINPKYVEMIKKRLKPFIGQEDLNGNVTTLEVINFEKD